MSRTKVLQNFEQLAQDILESDNVQQMAVFVQHGSTTTLDHTIDVAHCALRLADLLHLRVDQRSLVRGGILHDYFLYDWHDSKQAPDRWHGFTHPRHALRNAERDFPDLTEIERDVIAHHMFPLNPKPPHTREGWLVSAADKICAVREFVVGYRFGHSKSRP